MQTAYKTIVAQLQAVSVNVTAQPTQPTADASIFSSVLNVTWHLPGAQTWTYQSTVDVNNVAGSWQLAWKPSVVQSSLAAGDTLQYARLAPTRATILDGSGQPIVEARPVVDIGLEAGKVLDPTSTANQMSQILGVDAPSLVTRIKGSTSDEFVDIITLREPDYEKVAAQLAPIPGLVLRDLNEQLSPSHDFARSLIGTVGPVTKEIVQASNGRYISGDVGGLGGLEKDFDATLSGSPGFQITALHQAASPTVVYTQPPVQGTPLRTSLDQTVQAAADAALSTVTNQPSALVAVKVSTGQVIAVANGPDGRRLRCCVTGPDRAGISVQDRDDDCPARAGLQRQYGSAVPAADRRVRKDVPQLRRRATRQRALPYRLRQVVQHGVHQLGPESARAHVVEHRTVTGDRRLLVAGNAGISRIGFAAQGRDRPRRDVVRAGLDAWSAR